MASRPNTKGVMFNLDLTVYEVFKRHCKKVGRDMKTEASFAMLEHAKRGLQPLPPELQGQADEKPQKCTSRPAKKSSK